jgi:predicted nucleotide-binding protein
MFESSERSTNDDPRVFLGHGRSPVWRDLKDHLQDQHGLKVEAYETGSRAGHTIRDILEEMAARSNIAFLVLTGEDATAEGGSQARMNVIHETGLFQGKLDTRNNLPDFA